MYKHKNIIIHSKFLRGYFLFKDYFVINWDVKQQRKTLFFHQERYIHINMIMFTK
jgi:hypothetical protein